MKGVPKKEQPAATNLIFIDSNSLYMQSVIVTILLKLALSFHCLFAFVAC